MKTMRTTLCRSSLSDVTYKTAEVLQYLTHSFFSPPAPSTAPSKPELQLIKEVLETVTTLRLQCFVRCSQVENLTIFMRTDKDTKYLQQELLVAVMLQSITGHEVQLSACILQLTNQPRHSALFAHLFLFFVIGVFVFFFFKLHVVDCWIFPTF